MATIPDTLVSALTTDSEVRVYYRTANDQPQLPLQNIIKPRSGEAGFLQLSHDGLFMIASSASTLYLYERSVVGDNFNLADTVTACAAATKIYSCMTGDGVYIFTNCDTAGQKIIIYKRTGSSLA